MVLAIEFMDSWAAPLASQVDLAQLQPDRMLQGGSEGTFRALPGAPGVGGQRSGPNELKSSTYMTRVFCSPRWG